MMQEDNAWRVGVYWGELAGRRDQLRRIAEATGVEPVIWREGEPAPDVEALIASTTPDNITRARRADP